MDLLGFGYRIILSCLIFITWINLNLGFNLEYRLPVIKRGRHGDYFGYSVAEHQSIDEVTNEVTSWLLVGAPVGQNIQPETNHSGALYRCPISITNEDDCEQVVTDGKRDEEGRYPDVYGRKNVVSQQILKPRDDEKKDNQWLGVTVRSQGPGKKVLVCAHRYILKGENFQWGLGLCYTLSQHLDYDNAWEFCRGRETSYGHEQWGYCQIGTSGALLDDDTAIIGSPGPFTWRGTAFVVNISDEYLLRDKSIYQVSVKDSPVPKYSYLGMSVTGAKFFSTNYTTYVAGAPRADDVGKVILFSKPKHRLGNLNMKVELTLDGEQFASSFGYEVATADINGDKLPDLLVGAPFYFNKDEGGAVYIYTNDKHHLSNENKMRITGKLESRFGFAITNLGDINKDGCDDIAVSAPYEGDGVVYIYLGSPTGLSPKPDQEIRPSSSAPLNGIKTFGYSLSGGMDLDRNGYPDLLIGAYESDTVVLLRSRPIIGLRSTVDEKNLRKIDPDPSKVTCSKNPDSKVTCFTFDACVTVEAVFKDGSKLGNGNSLTLNYTLDADYKMKVRRVWIGHDKDTPSSISKNITLRKDPETNVLKRCHEHTVYIKDNTKDIQSPIKFRLVYQLVQKEPIMPKLGDRLPNVDNYPILNQREAVKTFEATFLKDCGDNDVCESHLIIGASLNLPYADEKANIWQLVLGLHDEIVLNITAYNDREPAYEAQLFINHPPSLSYVGKKSEGKQISCDPHRSEPMVICNLGNPFKKGITANIQLRFDHHDSLEDLQTMLKFEVFANSTSREEDYQGIQNLRANVIKQAELSIRGSSKPETVLYGGKAKGESAIKNRDEIGLRVQHIYQVFNKGPWKVPNLEVLIDWPFQVGNNKPQGKWLLYLEEEPVVDAKNGGKCFVSPEQVNPLKMPEQPALIEQPFVDTPTTSSPIVYNSSVESGQSHKRVRRNTEMIVRPEIYIDKGRKLKRFRMNCTLGTAKCIHFKCVITNLEKNHEATIIIKSRLWNSTLIEDYSDAEEVRIVSKAKLHVPPSSLVHQNSKDDEFEIETIAKEDNLGKLPQEPVDLWIYIVAIVIGLLLLLLLTLLLWKLGFFKRKRMEDPTLSGNLEKHKEY